MLIRSRYNYDRDGVSARTGIEVDRSIQSRVVQSQKDEADINVIVKRFGLTGHLPQNVRPPSYGDFTGVMDYHTAMNAVVQARESFEAMPANVRSMFRNDPQEFLRYCSEVDEDGKLKNIEEMRKLGLAVPAVDDIMPPNPDSRQANQENEDVDRNADDGVKGGASKTKSAGKVQR